MWIVSWDLFLVKKLIKSYICWFINSAQMHYSRLKKSVFTLKAKKKKKKKEGWNTFCAQTWTQNAQTKHSLRTFSFIGLNLYSSPCFISLESQLIVSSQVCQIKDRLLFSSPKKKEKTDRLYIYIYKK